MQRNLALMAVAVAATVSGCGDDVTGPGDDFSWSGAVAPGDFIEIKGVIGSISATHTDQAEVQVFAEVNGPDRDEIRFTVLRHDDGVTVCAVYPDAPGHLPNVCEVGDDGRMEVEGVDAEVTFSVLVPTGVDFVGRTVSGHVSARDQRGDVLALTVSGNVTISTTELAEAATVSGNVTVDLGSAAPRRDVEFAAVSGNVTVRVPATLSAHVELMTVSGSLSSAFALTEMSPQHWVGDLGEAARDVMLATVSGNVRLERLD